MISFQHIPFNVLIALSMLGTISCVSDIELDNGSEMPLVVNCVLSRSANSWYEMEEAEFWHPSDSEIPTQYLDLYRARRPSERTMQKIDDARVCVIDNNDIRHEFKWNGERWESHIEAGSGTSKGIELQFRKEGKVLKGQISYTLSKTDRLFPNLNQAQPFPAKFNRRHIFNANVSGTVLSDEKRELSIGAFFTYQSGHWETVPSGSWADDNFVTGKVDIDFYSTFNNYQMPPYVRVDLAANLKLRGRKHPQEFSAGVYNLLDRHNASWLSYNSTAGKWRQVSLLPIMPSLKYSIEF